MLKIGVSSEVIKAMAARENPATPTVAPAPPNGGVTVSAHDASSPTVPLTVRATSSSSGDGFTRIPAGSRLYIEPNDGFDTFLTAALDNKHVPITVVADRAQAEYVVESANDSQKAGWARIIALGQTGSNEEASVRIVKVTTGEIVWAYAVHKRNSFHGKQSSAEACAKHLKHVVQ